LELYPGLHQIRLPLIDSPLGWVNAYLIAGDAGYTLVDCGWDTPDVLDALRKGIDEIGVRLEQIRSLVITHNHPDHYGLAGRLVKLSRCSLVMHHLEAVHIESRYASTENLLGEMSEWLRINGCPAADLKQLTTSSMGIASRVNIALPDTLVNGGEHLDTGRYDFEIVWTPGHSAGHICLYERQRPLFISGDHILNPITPNIGLHAQSMGNPLADYLDSLEAVRELDVETVLPAHGEQFAGLQWRVDELLAHHEERLNEIRAALHRGPGSAYEVSAHLKYGRSGRRFADMQSFQQRMAVTEVLSHLELLHGRREVRKLNRDGVILYSLNRI
jgi:glyoxylase-like metal-dependent hydrolase (beta-lactamase superfamily II)